MNDDEFEQHCMEIDLLIRDAERNNETPPNIGEQYMELLEYSKSLHKKNKELESWRSWVLPILDTLDVLLDSVRKKKYTEGSYMKYEISEEQLEEIGILSDRADNFAYGVPGCPDIIARQALESDMRDIRDELRKLYVTITGDDPWEE